MFNGGILPILYVFEISLSIFICIISLCFSSFNGPLFENTTQLDGYQLRLPIKGGHTYAYWNKVYITTNKPWENWHEHAFEEL